MNRRRFLQQSTWAGAFLGASAQIPFASYSGSSANRQPSLNRAESREPLEVSDRKQLFIDRRFMDVYHGVDLVMNPAWQTGDLLLTADQPYETGTSIGSYCSIIKEDDGRIRLWYFVRGGRRDGVPRHLSDERIAYAESTDGIHFHKPELGLHEIMGSRANNTVIARLNPQGGEDTGYMGGCSVWIDPKAPPAHRYKTQARVYLIRGWPFQMYSSPDGLRWNFFAEIDPQGPPDTQTIIFWDEKYNKYLFYGRQWEKGPPHGLKSPDEFGHDLPDADVYGRKVRRAEMSELTRLQNTGLVAWPDQTDLSTYPVSEGQTPLDYYGATVFPYKEAEDVYIMMAQTFFHWKSDGLHGGGQPGGGPGTREVRLGISRDSKRFEWAGNRMPFLRMGPSGRFDSRGVWALPQPIIMGDEIWVYYFGTNQDRSGYIDSKVHGNGHMSGIGLAKMRLDGFVSADISPKGGEWTTPVLRFGGNRLQLNVDTSAGGCLKVEILDHEGQPLPGFSGSAGQWIVGNSVRMPVLWQNGSDLSELRGRPLRLRFSGRAAKVYAFQFV